MSLNEQIKLQFPANEKDEFISLDEAATNTDTDAAVEAAEIDRISRDTKAMPHLIEKIEGVFKIKHLGEYISPEEYKKQVDSLYEGNDNSEIYKKTG